MSNTKNNARRQETQRRIRESFLTLLGNEELRNITVTQVCQKAGINRSTFYANYSDVYCLADSLLEDLVRQVQVIQLRNDCDIVENRLKSLVVHIYENQELYRMYFKLGGLDLLSIDPELSWGRETYQNDYPLEHSLFFQAGFNAVVSRWLESGCKLPPEIIADILIKEQLGNRHP